MRWEKVKLGELCEITSSKRIFFSEYVKKGVPFYRSKEVIERANGKSVSDELYISQDKYDIIKRKFGVPHPGDILLTSVGTIGIPYVVKENDCFYFKDGNLTWFRNFGLNLNSMYLYYWIQSPEGQGVLNNTTIGSSQKALTITALKELKVPCPKIDVQNYIVKALKRYDDLIRNNQKQIKLLEEAAQRLYKEWFVDLRFPGYENTKIVDGVPEGWKRERLVDLVDVQYGYAFDGSLFNTSKKGMPIVRIRNIPDGSTNDYTTETADSQYIVHNSDILVGMDGEFHINSWSGPDAYLVQRTCLFRPNNLGMKGYLLQAINEPIKFYESTIVGATVSHLGKKHIDAIAVLTCPNDKLYEPLQKYFERRQLLLNQTRLLSEARDRLLPRLMGDAENF